MIKRLYIHNFRCLENFDLPLGEHSSVLLLGANGAGKTAVGLALRVFQMIARGRNRVGEIIKPSDFNKAGANGPLRLEIEATLERRNYVYTLALELPAGFRELRVSEEKLEVDGRPIYTREIAEVKIDRNGQVLEAKFRIDWHLVALPIVQESNPWDPLSVFKNWLRTLLVLRPVPSLVHGETVQNALDLDVPNSWVSNLGAWFSDIIAASPAAYATVSEYLAEVMPDFEKITNPVTGKDARNLFVHFEKDGQRTEFPVEELSDGEKCFLICALVIAQNTKLAPMVCFWDEPDNFLAPSEVGQSVLSLRKAFQNRGQLIMTSHNLEAIRRFSDSNTLLLSRKSHLEPTRIRSIENIKAGGQYKDGLVHALTRGDIEG